MAGTDPALGNSPSIPRKPAVVCGRPADQIQVAGLVDGERLMHVSVRVHVSCHRPT